MGSTLEMRTLMPNSYRDAQGAKLLGASVLFDIAAGDTPSQLRIDFGQPTHAVAADPEKVELCHALWSHQKAPRTR